MTMTILRQYPHQHVARPFNRVHDEWGVLELLDEQFKREAKRQDCDIECLHEEAREHFNTETPVLLTSGGTKYYAFEEDV